MWGRKDSEPEQPVAIGYILMAEVPAGKIMEVGEPMVAQAKERGYSWGGTYLDHATSTDTIAAMKRAATRNRAIDLVMVPTQAHLPDGLRAIATDRGSIRIISADSIDEQDHDTEMAAQPT